MLTHLVHFTPIPVTKEVAEELNTADPLGLRIELEIKLLKQFCTSPMFATQEREPFPQIADVPKRMRGTVRAVKRKVSFPLMVGLTFMLSG